MVDFVFIHRDCRVPDFSSIIVQQLWVTVRELWGFAIVLFLFLGELRSAFVVITALPLAMLIAFIFMAEAGLSANLMSLAGLAVGTR